MVDWGLGIVKTVSVIVAGFAIGIGATMASLAMGKIGKSALEGLTRQPEVAGTAFTAMLIAMALVEALCIYCLLIALMLIVANPLVA